MDTFEAFIPAEYYIYVYLIIAVFLVVSKTLHSDPLRPEEEKFSWTKTLILGGFFILFFGLRPEELTIYMMDTYNYVSGYNALKNNTEIIDTRNVDTDIAWEWLQNNMASLGFPAWTWLTVVAALYILPNIYGCKKLFPNNSYLAFLSYVAFFLFYSGGINGIRNADAYSMVFLGIAFLSRPSQKNYLICALLCLLGYGFHASAMITIFALLVSRFIVKRTDLAITIWVISIIIVLLSGSQLAVIASGFTDDERAMGEIVRSAEADILNGGFASLQFRWDFLLFSALPILMGWYVVIERQLKDKFYSLLLNTYIIANSVWVIFMYAQYSNRFAMLSWCLYPYVLLYPLIKLDVWHTIKQNRITVTALWVLMGFTLYISFA